MILPTNNFFIVSHVIGLKCHTYVGTLSALGNRYWMTGLMHDFKEEIKNKYFYRVDFANNNSYTVDFCQIIIYIQFHASRFFFIAHNRFLPTKNFNNDFTVNGYDHTQNEKSLLLVQQTTFKMRILPILRKLGRIFLIEIVYDFSRKINCWKILNRYRSRVKFG